MLHEANGHPPLLSSTPAVHSYDSLARQTQHI